MNSDLLKPPWQRVIPVVACVSALLAVAVVTGQSSSEAVALEVARRVAELADNDPHVRRAAEASIMELGIAALPHLPRPGPRAPAEVQLRLARIRRQLEQLQAESPARPSLVSLADPMTFGQAIDQLERQSGNRIVDARQSPFDPAPLVWDLPNATFWQAMARLMELSGTQLHDTRREPSALVLADRPTVAAPRPSATTDGLFRIETVRVTVLTDAPDAQASTWRVNLAVWWEPRVSLVCLKHRLGQVRYQVSPNDEIIGGDAEAVAEALIRSRVPYAEMSVTLADIPRTATRVASLAGDMEAVLLGREAEFVFPLDAWVPRVASTVPPKSDRQRCADVTVTVQDVCRRDQQWDVRLAVSFDRSGAAFESHRGWVFSNPAFLRDAEGVMIPPVAVETLAQQGSHYVLAYTFDATSLAGYEFVYRSPATVIEVPIHYHLQDIALP